MNSFILFLLVKDNNVNIWFPVLFSDWMFLNVSQFPKFPETIFWKEQHGSVSKDAFILDKQFTITIPLFTFLHFKIYKIYMLFDTRQESIILDKLPATAKWKTEKNLREEIWQVSSHPQSSHTSTIRDSSPQWAEEDILRQKNGPVQSNFVSGPQLYIQKQGRVEISDERRQGEKAIPGKIPFTTSNQNHLQARRSGIRSIPWIIHPSFTGVRIHTTIYIFQVAWYPLWIAEMAFTTRLQRSIASKKSREKREQDICGVSGLHWIYLFFTDYWKFVGKYNLTCFCWVL